jgi:hypothetical protein
MDGAEILASAQADLSLRIFCLPNLCQGMLKKFELPQQTSSLYTRQVQTVESSLLFMGGNVQEIQAGLLSRPLQQQGLG